MIPSSFFTPWRSWSQQHILCTPPRCTFHNTSSATMQDASHSGPASPSASPSTLPQLTQIHDSPFLWPSCVPSGSQHRSTAHNPGKTTPHPPHSPSRRSHTWISLGFTDAEPLRLEVEDEEDEVEVEVEVEAAASEESAVRTSGLVGRSATGRSNGDWQAGHCTMRHLAFARSSSAAVESFFFLEAAFPFFF